jgi:hypothetical protein
MTSMSKLVVEDVVGVCTMSPAAARAGFWPPDLAKSGLASLLYLPLLGEII